MIKDMIAKGIELLFGVWAILLIIFASLWIDYVREEDDN